MADRYFVETPIEGRHARLLGAEAHHLAHVMRAKPGHEVVLFDGGGAEFTARVERVGRSRDRVGRGLAQPDRSRIERDAVRLELLCPRAIANAGWRKSWWNWESLAWHRWRPSEATIASRPRHSTVCGAR